MWLLYNNDSSQNNQRSHEIKRDKFYFTNSTFIMATYFKLFLNNFCSLDRPFWRIDMLKKNTLWQPLYREFIISQPCVLNLTGNTTTEG